MRSKRIRVNNKGVYKDIRYEPTKIKNLKAVNSLKKTLRSPGVRLLPKDKGSRYKRAGPKGLFDDQDLF